MLSEIQIHQKNPPCETAQILTLVASTAEIKLCLLSADTLRVGTFDEPPGKHQLVACEVF